MSSFVDSLLSLAIAKQDKQKEDSPEGDVDSDHEGGAGSSRTSHNEYNGTASQQSTSADELENEEPATKRFRSSNEQVQDPSPLIVKELLQNVKVLSHQVELVMKKLNILPCDCKDCSHAQKQLHPGSLKRPRPSAASTPAPSRVHMQNGDAALNTPSNTSISAQTPVVGITPPVNIIQTLQEQTHCPTIRGRGRGRPMLIGDELHNNLVDHLVNYEIMNNTRLYPMDAFRHAQSYIKQNSPGLLAEEGGSVVLKQSWAVKLVTHVRSRKQKLIELVSQTTEKPEEVLPKINGDVPAPPKHSQENSLNGFSSHQHVVPEQFGSKQDFTNDSTVTCDSDIVMEKLGLETDSTKLGPEADPSQLASFASLLASLQQSTQ